LEEMRMSLAFPWRRVFKVDLYPRLYLPLFMTKAKRELMVSVDFFYIRVKENDLEFLFMKNGWARHTDFLMDIFVS
jgi:hypothetical protein